MVHKEYLLSTFSRRLSTGAGAGVADVTTVAEPSAAPGLVGRGQGRLLPPPQPHCFPGSSLAYALVGPAWGRFATTGVRVVRNYRFIFQIGSIFDPMILIL